MLTPWSQNGASNTVFSGILTGRQFAGMYSVSDCRVRAQLCIIKILLQLFVQYTVKKTLH